MSTLITELLKKIEHAEAFCRKTPALSPISTYRHPETELDPRIRIIHTVAGMSYYAWSNPDQYKIVQNHYY
jgi:hypothetical protein